MLAFGNPASFACSLPLCFKRATSRRPFGRSKNSRLWEFFAPSLSFALACARKISRGADCPPQPLPQAGGAEIVEISLFGVLNIVRQVGDLCGGRVIYSLREYDISSIRYGTCLRQVATLPRRLTPPLFYEKPSEPQARYVRLWRT